MKGKTLCLWSCTVSHMTILQKATKRLTKLLNAVQRVCLGWNGDGVIIHIIISVGYRYTQWGTRGLYDFDLLS
jgi:hypothetical protein